MEGRRDAVGAGSARGHRIALAIAVFVLMIGLGIGLGARSAAGDETAQPTTELPATAPTIQLTEEAVEEAKAEGPEEGEGTEPLAADELPHRDLDRAAALELVEGVFGPQLEGQAGIFGEIEPEKDLLVLDAHVQVADLQLSQFLSVSRFGFQATLPTALSGLASQKGWRTRPAPPGWCRPAPW